MNITQALQEIINHKSLTMGDAALVMKSIMEGEGTQAQIASLVTALRMKGETSEEIAGFASAMRDKSLRITPRVPVLVDTCGTGGDSLKTFNISTTTAFVVAGAGVAVAKHGNRRVTSKSGSADLLEALGVNLEVTPDFVQRSIERLGIGFLFAPSFHPAMKYAAPVRREIGIRTVFNILGPLTNPAGADRQVIGVYAPELTDLLADVLNLLGVKQAFVVHGMVGLDEWSNTGVTRVSELKNGVVTTNNFTAADFGLSEANPDDLAGGDPQENAKIVEAILKGEKGAKRDIVLLNAAAVLTVADAADSIRQGIEKAAESIDTGAAWGKVEALKAMTNAVLPS
ncbi:MAG: anthranilate phosphoribosyltransferase [bacterium]